MTWSDGEPLTARDVEFGIKRVLDPASPGSSVAIYFALENGQAYYLGESSDTDAIGVRALDDRTVEFRLVAPAPYFLSVMEPAMEAGTATRDRTRLRGEAWCEADRQVVSGPFAVAARTENTLVLRRRDDYAGVRSGNVAEVEFFRTAIVDALPGYERDETDMILVRYAASGRPDPGRGAPAMQSSGRPRGRHTFASTTPTR